MRHRVFEQLTSENFLLKFGIISNSRAVHRALELSDEVAQLSIALFQGEIDEKSIRRFVSQLLSELQIGKLFPYDMTLAAIAVAIQRRPTAFAEEFLLDLARLDRAEMPISIRVARHAARVHSQIPRNKITVCSLVPPDQLPAGWREIPALVESETGHVEKQCEYGAA